MNRLATIGYERETQAQVIDRLKQAGIDYLHFPQLGTPKPGRDAARKGRTAEMRRIFEDHLAEPAAQLELAKAVEVVRERRAALLCYEADHKGCHRAIVAERIREELGCEVVNL